MTVVRSLPLLGTAGVLLLSACSGASAGADSVGATPLQALLTIDQLGDPGFTVYTPAHTETASQLAGGAAATSALVHDGFQSAAVVRYTRDEVFSTANGPVDVTATAERFGTAAGAAAVLTDDITRLDGQPGATPISTGPLADGAHAVQEVRTLTDGLSAVQYTVEWRVANMLNVIVTRGRDGGTTLQDALTLAYAQDVNEPLKTS